MTDTTIPSTVTFGKFVADIADLPATSVHRLLTLGFSAAIQNSVAGLKTKLKGEGASDSEIADAMAEKQQAQFDAILSGTAVSTARGPRAVGVESYFRTVAIERFRAAVNKVGKKMPKGEAYKEFLAKYIEANRVAIQREAEKRFADAQEATDDFDMDALLGDEGDDTSGDDEGDESAAA